MYLSLFLIQFSLLENSQTFLGTLTTLAVLCLYFDNSSYIINIITSLKKDLIRNVPEVYDFSLEKLNTSLSHNHWYSEEIDDDAKQEIYIKIDDAQFKALEIEEELKEAINKITKSAEKIQEAKEYRFVALYIFLFCIIILSIDILKTDHPLVINFLGFYIAASFAFTFVLWKRYLEFTELTSTRDEKIIENVYKSPLEIVWYFLAATLIIIYLVHIANFLANTFASFFQDNPAISTFSYLSILAFLIGCVSLFFSRKHLYTINYNWSFLLSHIFYILIIGLLVTGYLTFLNSGLVATLFLATGISCIYFTCIYLEKKFLYKFYYKKKWLNIPRWGIFMFTAILFIVLYKHIAPYVSTDVRTYIKDWFISDMLSPETSNLKYYIIAYVLLNIFILPLSLSYLRYSQVKKQAYSQVLKKINNIKKQLRLDILNIKNDYKKRIKLQEKGNQQLVYSGKVEDSYHKKDIPEQEKKECKPSSPERKVFSTHKTNSSKRKKKKKNRR